MSATQTEASALRMLSKRDYPVEELREKLLNKGAQKPDVDALIQRYLDYGYLDDDRIARRQVGLLAQQYGPIRIRQKLCGKGLDRDLVDTYLDEIEPSLYVEVALRRIRRRFGEPADLELKEKQKVYRHLAGRGYPSSLIRQALDAPRLDEDE